MRIYLDAWCRLSSGSTPGGRAAHAPIYLYAWSRLSSGSTPGGRAAHAPIHIPICLVQAEQRKHSRWKSCACAYIPRCLVQAEQRKHSRWKSWVLARITKSFLVKVFWQAEHRALYSLDNKGNYYKILPPPSCILLVNKSVYTSKNANW